MSPEIIEHQCREIRERLAKGDDFPIACLNFLISHASGEQSRKDWAIVGQRLAESGCITLNSENKYEVNV